MKLPRLNLTWNVNLTPKQRRILFWLSIPAFYFFCLAIFVRLTFPYDTLRQRVLTEFNSGQTERHLRIDHLSGSGLFGVSLEGVELTEKQPPGTKGAAPALFVDELDVSVSVLSYLFGNLAVDFDALIGGGELSGDFFQNEARAELSASSDEVDISGLTLLSKSVGLPLGGVLFGTVELRLPERKMARAIGKFDLKVDGLTVGDGKAKVRDTIALPKINAGQLTLKAEATDGRLDITEFGCNGPDFEMSGTGRLRLRPAFDRSVADIDMAFRFKEAYTTKNEITKTLFGSADSKIPALFDMDPTVRRAKGEDGFYRWRVTGLLGNPAFRPGKQPGGREPPAR